MSKQLPYFKFFPNEWLSGDITLEQMELQGAFINVCAIYWSKECRVAMARLSQRYGEAITRLLESGLLKEKDGFAVISFLDEQWVELGKYHQINSKNGKKGADIRWGKNGEAIAFREEEIREDKNREEKKITNNSVFDLEFFESIKSYWGVGENKYAGSWFSITAYINSLGPRLPHVKAQFECYKKLKDESGQIKHSLNSFLQGDWEKENWEHKLKEHRKKDPDAWRNELSKEPPPLPKHHVQRTK